MFLSLLVVILLGEAYRRSRGRLHAMRPTMPAAWRALRGDLGHAFRRVAAWEWIGLALVTALGASLRMRYLDQPIRYDEAATWLDYASQPLGRALSDYRFPNHHLFHTLLVHLSAAMFGSAPWALRLPALAAGIALVPLTWALARTLHSREAALGAAGLAAASTTLVLYSTNARGYTILACLTVILALLATRLARADNPAGWAAMAATAALGAWTIPVMLYPAGAIALWLWLEARGGAAAIDARAMRSRLRWTGLAALCLTAVLYLPVVARTGLALVIGNRFVRPQSRSEFFAKLPGFLRDVGLDFSRGWNGALAVLLGAALVVGLVSGRARRHRVPLLGAMLAWSLLLLVANGRLPYLRVWMFLLPFALAAAAAGLDRAVRLTLARAPSGMARAASLAALAIVVTSAAVGLVRSDAVRRAEDTGTLRDGAAIAALLIDRARPRDRVIASAPADLPLAYALQRQAGSTDLLHATPDSAHRLWIVVNDAVGQREDSLLRAAEIVTGDFGVPLLVGRFREASVHARSRVRPGCVLDPAICR